MDPAEQKAREAAYLAAEDQARNELGDAYKLVEIGEAATFDGLTENLDIEERLHALIDKCLKRLLFLRTQIYLEGAIFSASGAYCRALESCVTGK